MEATPVHVDDRGVVAELALKRNAAIAPHSNPNLTYFVIIEGGGFVQVGDERARVAAGEAVVWPPNVVHAVWTELTPMRAIVVEFAPAHGEELPLLSQGAAGDSGLLEEAPVEPKSADGGLATKPAVAPLERKSPEREPW